MRTKSLGSEFEELVIGKKLYLAVMGDSFASEPNEKVSAARPAAVDAENGT
jgi:hypothetical protein